LNSLYLIVYMEYQAELRSTKIDLYIQLTEQRNRRTKDTG